MTQRIGDCSILLPHTVKHCAGSVHELRRRNARNRLYRTLLERRAGQSKYIRRGNEVSAATRRTTMSLQQAITEFRGQFRGAVIEPEDAAYEEARKVYNGMIDRRPRLIAKCTDVADVMAAVRMAKSQWFAGFDPRWRAQCGRSGRLRRRHGDRSGADQLREGGSLSRARCGWARAASGATWTMRHTHSAWPCRRASSRAPGLPG